MGLFVGGRAVKSMHLNGRTASQAYLGTILVWDGTSPAFVSAVRAIVGAYLADPGVSAHAAVEAPALQAAGIARAAVPRATATPTAQRAFAAASVGGSTVTADASIDVETATVSVRSTPPLSDNDVAAVIAEATALVAPPAIRTPGIVFALPVNATTAATAPSITASANTTPSTATASAAARNPGVQRGATVTAIRATATTGVTAPNVQAVNFQNSGMTKNGTQEVNSGTTSSPAWTIVAPWSPRSGFAGTVIEDNGIRVPAGVTVNITYRVPFSTQPGPSAYTYTRLTNDGVEIPGSTVYTSGYSDAAAVTLTGLVGTGGIVRVEGYGNSSASRRTVTTAAYIEITKA